MYTSGSTYWLVYFNSILEISAPNLQGNESIQNAYKFSRASIPKYLERLSKKVLLQTI